MSETTTAAPETAAPGPLTTLGGVFSSPREAFGAELRRPRFWIPLLGAIALNLAFGGIWLQKVEAYRFMKQQIEESPQAGRLSPEMIDQAARQQAGFMKYFVWLGWIGVVVVSFVVGALFLFVFRFFYAGELSFGQSMSVTCWSYFAVGLVQTPLMLLTYWLKDDWNVNPQEILQANLSVLFERAETAKPLWALASSLDLFSFWTMFLLSTGYAVAVRRTTGGAFVGVAALWAVYVLGKVALAAVF